MYCTPLGVLDTVGAGYNDAFSTKWYLLASLQSASNRHGFEADSRYNDLSNLMDVFKSTAKKTTFIYFDRFGHIVIARVRLQMVPVTDCLQSRNGGQKLYSSEPNTSLYPAPTVLPSTAPRHGTVRVRLGRQSARVWLKSLPWPWGRLFSLGQNNNARRWAFLSHTC
jgi:hypothetical protein